jgi:hypothetical protein
LLLAGDKIIMVRACWERGEKGGEGEGVEEKPVYSSPSK